MDTRDKQGQSIELLNGMPAILRPILPGDAEALLRFHANPQPGDCAPPILRLPPDPYD